jgi:ABC-2 type transport system permease protein
LQKLIKQVSPNYLIETKMIFLKKFLQKNHKWLKILSFNFNSSKSNLAAFYVIQISNISQSLITVFIWSQANSDPKFLTYLLLGRVFNAFTYSFYHEDLSNYIDSGKITSKLLRPQNFLKVELFSTIGERLAKNPATILGFVIATIIANFSFAPTVFSEPINILLVLAFIPIAFFIQFILSFIIGSLSFFISDKRDVWAYQSAYETINSILAGSFIPLNNSVLPSFLQFLPFGFLLHHPMQIYLNNYSPFEIFFTFFGGILWCIFLYFVAKLVFKIGLKRNESVGL